MTNQGRVLATFKTETFNFTSTTEDKKDLFPTNSSQDINSNNIFSPAKAFTQFSSFLYEKKPFFQFFRP